MSYDIITADQNTQEWKGARIGIPSASKASDIVTSKGARSASLPKYAHYLAECIVAGFDVGEFSGNNSTNYGHKTEPEAISAYELRFDCDIERVGFCVKRDSEGNALYGCSPDGLIHIRTGGIESKSLPKEHSSTLLYYRKHGCVPSTRVPQVQMQILVCDLEYVDNWFYRPGLPSLRYRHDPDPVIQRALKMYLPECIALRDKHVKFLKEFTYD